MRENQRQRQQKLTGYGKNLSRSFTLSIGFHALLLLLSLLSLGRFAQELGSGDGGDLGRGDFQQAALVGLSVNLEAPTSATVPPAAATPAEAEDKTQVPPVALNPPEEIPIPENAEAPEPEELLEIPLIVPEKPQAPPQTTPTPQPPTERDSETNDSDAGSANSLEQILGLPMNGQDGDSEKPGDPGGDGGKIREMKLKPRVLGWPRSSKNKLRDDFVLRNLVGKDGRVLEVRVLQGGDECDECRKAAIEAAFRCEYFPGRVNGELVEAWTLFVLKFR